MHGGRPAPVTAPRAREGAEGAGGRREELHGAGRAPGGCYEPAMRGGGLPQVGLRAHKTHRDSGNPLKSLRFAGLDENPTGAQGLDAMRKCADSLRPKSLAVSAS